MSSILKKTGDSIRKRFFPDKVAEDAGVKFLNQAGFLRERFDRIEQFSDTAIIKKESGYTLTTLPWLDIGKKPDNFDRNDYMNDLLEYYQELCDWILKLKLEELTRMNDEIRGKRLKLRTEGVEENKLPALLERSEEVIADLPVDPGLSVHRSRIERFLRWGGDTLLGISFANPDDNRSIIMRTPVVFEQGRTRMVYKGGDQGEGSVKEIPE